MRADAMDPDVARAAQEAPAPLRRRRVRSALPAIALVLVLLAVAGVMATGWYFSDQVLTVTHASTYDVPVRAVSEGTVTLGRAPDSSAPGRYGLEWPGGRAEIAQITGSDPASVTRRLDLTGSGARPPASGTLVDVTERVRSGDPSSVGLPFQQVDVPGPLGALPAWLVPGNARPAVDGGGGTGRWVIAVHGRGASREEALRVLPALHRLGLTTLVVSYRNDIGAPPSPDARYHLGDTEWEDVDAAISYARGRGARDVVLYGWSMGGMVAMETVDRSPRRDAVRAVILDAPVLDWRNVLDHQGAARGLPRWLTRVAEGVAAWRSGVDYDELDQVAAASRLELPVLIFHGSADDYVPAEPSAALAQARPDLVRYVSIAARHTTSWNVDSARYERELADFLGRPAS